MKASARRTAWPITSLVIAVVVGAACSSGGVTVQQYPDLDRRVTRMDGNSITIDRNMSNSLVINGAKVEDADSSRYVLWIQMRGSNAVRPERLTLTVDKEPAWVLDDITVMDAAMTCPERTQVERNLGVSEVFGCVYQELYWSPISAQQLTRMANAYQVTARLDGVRGYVERRFSPKNIAAFAEFVAKHVTTTTETSSTSSSAP